MRVRQVSNFYPPYWVGGYEQIAAWVTEGLRESGHQVHVLPGRGPAFAGRPEIRAELDLDLALLSGQYFGEGITREGGLGAAFRRHVFSLPNFRACRRVIAELRPDLVSCWNLAYLSYSPLLAARRAGVPVRLHLSDQVVNPFRSPPATRHPTRWLSRTAVDGLLRVARPAQFAVPSAFLRDKFVATEGLPAERIHVLPWPVEPTISRKEVPARKPSAPLRLLFVGTPIPEKGPEVLIAALRQALAQRADLALTLVGEGPAGFVSKLREVARDLPVHFAGRLDRPAVIEAYEAHDVFVFPSIWDEPFGAVSLEAMAMGLPVLASGAGGIPEVVLHEQRGLLVPRGDTRALAAAILRLAGDPALRVRLAEPGCRWARATQSFPVFMQRLERLYEGLVLAE